MLLAEGSRVPVDDPNTHLELTMIHEVMILDYSGPDLAFISLFIRIENGSYFYFTCGYFNSSGKYGHSAASLIIFDNFISMCLFNWTYRIPGCPSKNVTRSSVHFSYDSSFSYGICCSSFSFYAEDFK